MRFLLHENRILPIPFTMRQFKEKDYENAYAKMVHSNRGVIHVNTWLSKGSIMIENQGCYVLRETDVSLFKTKIFSVKDIGQNTMNFFFNKNRVTFLPFSLTATTNLIPTRITKNTTFFLITYQTTRLTKCQNQE